MLIAHSAAIASSTANPWINGIEPLVLRNAYDRGAMRLNRSTDLVPECERQVPLAAEIEPFTFTQVEIAIHQVKIAVA
jgi:hypothetical protein